MTTEELNALIAQAEGGDVAAMNQLGQIYGGNEFKDFEKAFYWHKKAAELGNVNSMSNLGGWCYLQGNGTEKNIPLADEWLKKAAENGWQWAWAFNQLAHIFGADDENKNYEKAFYWYKKGAEAGDVNCMSNVGGWCYRFGNGTEKNIPLAIEWLEKAAEQNDIWSMNRLTEIYGEEEGFINHEQAAKWFLELIKRDCETERPQTGGMMAPPPPPGMSRVYENTGYNKDLYEKVKNAVLNSATEEEMMSSMSGGSGGSLLGGAMSFTTYNAKSYINQAEEAIQRNIEYKEEQRRKAAEEEARKRAEEERARREAEERARHEREERERQEREKKEQEEKEKRVQAFSIKVQKDYDDYDEDIEETPCSWDSQEMEIVEDKNVWWNDNRPVGGGYWDFKEYKKTLIIPEGVTHIGNNAFWGGCNLFNSIELPKSLTSIGKNAFYALELHEDLILPDSVTSIGESAFEGCVVSSVTIGNGVTSIGKRAFYEASISSITIPDSVVNIGEEAFCTCGLETIYLPNGVVRIKRNGNPLLSAYIDKIIVPKEVKKRFLEIFGNYTAPQRYMHDFGGGFVRPDFRTVEWSELVIEK